MAGVIFDRFGRDVPIAAVDADHFQATVNVAANQQFIGWVVAQGRAVRIVGPENVIERMREEIGRLSEQYGSR